MNRIFWLVYLSTILPFAVAHGQQPQAPPPLIWHIPVMPVLPPAPVQPVAPMQPWVQPQQPQQAFRIHYPTPLRSFLFGSRIVPVQPPPTMIRTPYVWGPIQ